MTGKPDRLRFAVKLTPEAVAQFPELRGATGYVVGFARSSEALLVRWEGKRRSQLWARGHLRKFYQ